MFCQRGFGWRGAAYLNNIGDSLTSLGRTKGAEEYLLRALELIESDPHPHTEAVIYDSLGATYTALGQHHAALRCLRRAIETFDKLGDRAQKVVCLIHMSQLREATGHLPLADEMADEAHRLGVETGSRSLIATASERLKEIREVIAVYEETHRPVY